MTKTRESKKDASVESESPEVTLENTAEVKKAIKPDHKFHVHVEPHQVLWHSGDDGRPVSKVLSHGSHVLCPKKMQAFKDQGIKFRMIEEE